MGVDFRWQAGGGGELDAGAAGQLLQSVAELDVLDPHIEGEGVAAFAAAEAMEIARLGKDDEGGRFLLVEGTETLVGAPGLLQLDVLGNDVDDVGALAHLGDGIPGHGSLPSRELHAPFPAPLVGRDWGSSDGPVLRDEHLLVDLDRETIGHAGDEVGHAAGRVVIDTGCELGGKTIGVGDEVGEQGADDVLGPLCVRVLVERSVHAAKEELSQRIGGLADIRRQEDRAAVVDVRGADDVTDEGVDAFPVRGAEDREDLAGHVLHWRSSRRGWRRRGRG